MKNPSIYILSEFYRLLNGNLTYNSNLIPVYNNYQDVADSDLLYVLIQNPIQNPNNTKDGFRVILRTQIDVVHRIRGQAISSIPVETVAGQITALLMPNVDGGGTMNHNTDFEVIYNIFSNSFLDESRSNTDNIKRKVLFFETQTLQK